MNKVPTFFRKVSHKQFDYKPLYYDANKEERDRRSDDYRMKNAEIKSEGGGSGEIKFKRDINKASQRANIRLIIIIIALVGIAYYIIIY